MVALNATNDVVARASAVIAPPAADGPWRQQAAAEWWCALETAFDDLCGQLDPRDITAIAVDGTSGTLLLTDAAGTPLGPALMYNDARALDEARAIRDQAPDSAAASASASLAKLLWLQTHTNTAAARHALHQADWVMGRLCGRYGLSDEHNCLKLGYDPVARAWPTWLARLDTPVRLLPRVIAPGATAGGIDPAIAQRFGLADTVRVVAGTTDSTAAALAAGVSAPGDAVTSLGSTLVVKVVSSTPVFSSAHGIYSHRLGDHWLTGGASNTGGAVLRAFFSTAELERMTPLLQPDQPTGLDYYPLCTPGERFPVADPALPARLTPRPQDPVRFFQGMLEGMARIEAQGYRLLHELGAPAHRVVYTSGGGAANPAWRLLRETAIGAPVRMAQYRDAAVGAAMLASTNQE